MNMFALVLTRAAGEPLEQLFRRRIAEPIAMNPAGWRWGDFGEIGGVRVNGGAGNQDRQVFINARELARLGHARLSGHPARPERRRRRGLAVGAERERQITLSPRQGIRGGSERIATFHTPGTVANDVTCPRSVPCCVLAVVRE